MTKYAGENTITRLIAKTKQALDEKQDTLPTSSTAGQVLKSTATAGTTQWSNSDVTEITTQYVGFGNGTDSSTRTYIKSAGIYKLTYNGTKYINYYGTSTSTTYRHTVAGGAGAVYLFVNMYSTSQFDWYYINGSGSSYPSLYFGYTLNSSTGGNFSNKALGSLLTSAVTSLNNSTGALTLKTVNNNSLLGSGNIDTSITSITAATIIRDLATGIYQGEAQYFKLDTSTSIIDESSELYTSSKVVIYVTNDSSNGFASAEFFGIGPQDSDYGTMFFGGYCNTDGYGYNEEIISTLLGPLKTVCGKNLHGTGNIDATPTTITSATNMWTLSTGIYTGKANFFKLSSSATIVNEQEDFDGGNNFYYPVFIHIVNNNGYISFLGFGSGDSGSDHVFEGVVDQYGYEYNELVTDARFSSAISSLRKRFNTLNVTVTQSPGANTAYQATALTCVIIWMNSDYSSSLNNTSGLNFWTSPDGSNWTQVARFNSTSGYPKFGNICCIVPKGAYFRTNYWGMTGGGNIVNMTRIILDNYSA